MDKMLDPNFNNPTELRVNNVKYNFQITEEKKEKLEMMENQLYSNTWIDKQRSNMAEIGEQCYWFKVQMEPWIERHHFSINFDSEVR